MANLSGFNAYEVEPAGDFSPLPNYKYAAMIVESQIKNNKKNNGYYLELEFLIIEGEYKGRKVWSRLNIGNANPIAKDIAMGQLSAICRAVHVMTHDDSSEFHNIPLYINVICKERTDGKGITNEISSYEEYGDMPPIVAPSTQPQAQTPLTGHTSPTTPVMPQNNAIAPWAQQTVQPENIPPF